MEAAGQAEGARSEMRSPPVHMPAWAARAPTARVGERWPVRVRLPAAAFLDPGRDGLRVGPGLAAQPGALPCDRLGPRPPLRVPPTPRPPLPPRPPPPPHAPP